MKQEQKIKEFIIKMNDKIVITFGSTLSLTAISLIEQDLKSLLDNWIKCSDEDPETIDYLLIVVDGDTLYGYWDGKEYQVMKGLGGYLTVKPTLHQPLPQSSQE